MDIDGSSFFNHNEGGFFNDPLDESFGATTTAAPSPATEFLIIVDRLSDTQEKIMSVLFVFSATLSILGSSTIVYKVVKNRAKATPYDRIMLGLSGCDVIASLAWILTPFLLPHETSSRVWALGTPGTCSFVGTLTQFGFCAIVYNCVLSIYYLLTVKFGVKRHMLAARYEKYMHALPLCYFFLTAVAGAILGVYSEVDLGMGCWVNEYPRGCEVDDSCISDEIAWAFGAGPTIITLLALIVNNIIIYFHVKKMLKGGESNAAANNNTATTSSLEKERAIQYKKHIREVATQGFLYVGTFLVAYSPAIALRVIDAYGTYPIAESPIFPLFVLQSLFLPLQGFFNMFVYNKPSFVRVRTAYPDKGIFWTIQKACLDSDIPRLLEASRISRMSSRKSLQNHPKPASRSGGRNFSSDLCVLHEASQEEELEDSSSSSDGGSVVRDATASNNDANSTARTEDMTSGEIAENGESTTSSCLSQDEEAELKQAFSDAYGRTVMSMSERTTTSKTSTGKPRSMPNLKLDSSPHVEDNNNNAYNSEEEYDEELNTTTTKRPRSVPDFGCNDDYSSDEDFDLEEDYTKIFGNGQGGVRRIAFDGSVHHNQPS